MAQQIPNKTLFIGDNLPILRNIDTESIDLIYIDPPFNSNRKYYEPIGDSNKEIGFDDTFRNKDYKEGWVEETKDRRPQLSSLLDTINKMGEGVLWESRFAYSVFMAVRLIEIHRILKPTGSLYLHCDSAMSHYLKLVLDVIFGADNFHNEIIWHYGGARGAKAGSRQYPRTDDVLLFYTKSKNYTYKQQTTEYQYTLKEAKEQGFRKDKQGWYKTAPRGDYTDKSIKELKKQGRIHITRNDKVRIKTYLRSDESYIYEDKPVENVWHDISDMMHTSKKERTGYSTQKPLTLLNRIIEASSNEGDIVLDAFCGCATTLIAANNLHRQWIGIDKEKGAIKLLKQRLEDNEMGREIAVQLQQQGEQGKYKELIKPPTIRDDRPTRTDTAKKYSRKEMIDMLYGRTGGYCYICKEHFEKRQLELDHIVPKSKGGQDFIDNRALICGNCNRIKGNRPIEYARDRLKQLKDEAIYRGDTID